MLFGIIELLVKGFEKRSLYPHTLIYSMGLGHSDPWVELHIWPQQKWVKGHLGVIWGH